MTGGALMEWIVRFEYERIIRQIARSVLSMADTPSERIYALENAFVPQKSGQNRGRLRARQSSEYWHFVEFCKLELIIAKPEIAVDSTTSVLKRCICPML